MANNQPNSRQRPVLWNIPPNLPARLIPPPRMQEHVGQVVRGVIPGAGPQPEYHPNPYLQHIYSRHANREDSHDNLVDLGDIEAHLQEVISHSAQNLVEAETDGNNDPGGSHGHTHGGRNLSTETLDWKVFMGSFAFSVILLLRLLADHILGILVFLGLTVVFYYANTKMIEIVHITSLRERQHTKSVFVSCVVLLTFLTAQVAGIYIFFEDQELWRVLQLQLPPTWKGDLFDLFWVTMVTDYIIRYGTIAVKCFISVIPNLCVKQKRKGKYYMFIETLSQNYRTVLPTIPWLHFLYDEPKSGKLIFSAILAVIYVILKAWCLVMEGAKLKKAFKVLRTDTKFGVEPSLEDIKSRGENCPICQDDYQDPVMLSCKHIFCENCVSIWFDREKTCPMCRAQIQTENPIWQDGSTSAHLQWF